MAAAFLTRRWAGIGCWSLSRPPDALRKALQQASELLADVVWEKASLCILCCFCQVLDPLLSLGGGRLRIFGRGLEPLCFMSSWFVKKLRLGLVCRHVLGGTRSNATRNHTLWTCEVPSKLLHYCTTSTNAAMAKKLRAVNVAGRLMLLGLSLGLFFSDAFRTIVWAKMPAESRDLATPSDL